MPVIENIRNGGLKVISIMVAVVTISASGIIGSITLDGRYVHADTYQTDHRETLREIRNVERARIQDELFKLQLIPADKRSTIDNAVIDKYQERLRQLDSLDGAEVKK